MDFERKINISLSGFGGLSWGACNGMREDMDDKMDNIFKGQCR